MYHGKAIQFNWSAIEKATDGDNDIIYVYWNYGSRWMVLEAVVVMMKMNM